jgi:xanthine dehydrogenase accessory factor
VENQEVLRALLDAQEQGTPAALVTVISTQGSMPRHAGSKMLVRPNGEIVGTIGGGAMEAKVIGDAQSAINDGKTRIVHVELNDMAADGTGVCGGSAELFIEPLATPLTLVVIGCGHVGKALAQLGKWANFRVIVSDDRAEYCNPQHIPGMDGYVVASPADVPKHIALGPRTYIAAVTRGLPVDVDLFPALMQADVPYVGLIGSRRRWAITIKALKERGLSQEQIDRVHAPIGLELQAETPQEIAISILAEIIMVRRGGTGEPMQDSAKSNALGASE